MMNADLVEEAESVGKFALPAICAVAYAIWLLFSVGWDSTNALILGVLGLLTFTFAGGVRQLALLPATLLGFYQFAIIGLFALGMAISEWSGWDVILVATLWTLIGWRCLDGVAKRKRRLRRIKGGIT